MAADASDTRAKLMVAGERLFATDGIHGAQMRDVVRSAGQANDSAVHYHFGSRQGLLHAICERHIAEMEPERRLRLAAQPPQPPLEVVVADLLPCRPGHRPRRSASSWSSCTPWWRAA